MVTAISFGKFLGPLLRALRQRAASTISAVESGPPETASTSAGKWSRSEKSDLASVAETGAAFCVGMIFIRKPVPSIESSPRACFSDHTLAVRTLLFLRDAAFRGSRGARKFAPDFGQRGAGRFLLIERVERLSEPQQGVRRLAGVLEFSRDRQEGFRRVAIALALEQALAQPILRVRHQLFVRIFAQEIAERLLGQRVIFVQHIAIRHVVFVLRRRRRRQRCKLGAGGAGVARRRQLRRRHRRRVRHRPCRLRRRITGKRRQIERSARGAAAGRADRRLVIRVLDRGGRRFVAEDAWRAGRIGMLGGIEYVGAVAGRGGHQGLGPGWWRHRARGCARGRCALGAKLLEAILGIFLHALEPFLELLVTVLQLLERAGELAQRTFHAVEADGQIAGIGLRHARLLRWTLVALELVALALRRRRLAAAEQIIEEAAGRTLLLRRRRAGQKQQRKRGERRDTNSVS